MLRPYHLDVTRQAQSLFAVLRGELSPRRTPSRTLMLWMAGSVFCASDSSVIIGGNQGTVDVTTAASGRRT